MSVGLTNAPIAFMDVMNNVFRNYLDSFVIVFIDDILAYSKNDGDHMKHLTLVFQEHKDNKLFALYDMLYVKMCMCCLCRIMSLS